MSYILTFLAGFFTGMAGLIGYTGYHYYKAWKEAYDEGWDMPS